MAIVDRHIDTRNYTGSAPGGLSPYVHNVMAHWAGFPAASASNNVKTTAISASALSTSQSSTTTTGAGSTVTTLVQTTTWGNRSMSFATATAQDYPRAVVVALGGTASSASITGGALYVYGADVFGSTRSTSYAATALRSTGVVAALSVNFAVINTLSAEFAIVTHTKAGTTTSASDGASTTNSAGSAALQYTISVGQGQKLGVIPQSIRSSNAAVPLAWVGTAVQSTWSQTASTSNNQYTVVTGDYYLGGISFSSAYSSNSLLQIYYRLNG